jgi:hypothetical protein
VWSGIEAMAGLLMGRDVARASEIVAVVQAGTGACSVPVLAYAKQVHERQEKRLRRRANELGYELTPIEEPKPTTSE